MGSSLYGQKSTLGATDSNLHISIEDQVVNFPKYRRELINRLDGSNFKKAVTSHKYEWSTRDNRKLQADLAINIAADATEMTVDEPGVFNVDDVFQMPDGSQHIVESVAGGVKVTFRNITGASARTTHAGGATMVIVGSGTPQGKDADNMVITGIEDLYNYTSNFEDVVELSDMENEALIRGEEGSSELLARKQMELTEKLQRALVVGQRYIDKSRKVTTMAGLKDLIDLYAPENAIDFGGDIWATDRTVEDKIDDALDVIAEKAFKKPVMYVSPSFMRKFKYIQDDQFRTDPGAKGRGIGVVKMYNSHTFGEVEVVQLQGMGSVMDDLVFMVDESQFGYKAYRNLGWHTYQLGRTGQSFKWQVAGIYTAKLDTPQAAVYLHNLGL